MANFQLTFFGTDEEYETQLVCYMNDRNEIYIKISRVDDPNDDSWQFITLDKSTAIKVAKTLRTEINKLEDVNNG